MASIYQMGDDTLLQLIQEARSATDDANRQLVNLEAEYNTRLNQSSPVSKIPADILLSIFQIAQSQSEDTELPIEIRVSRVSSFWRRVVAETPILWSNIALKASSINNRTVTWWRGPQVLELYTSRFESRPLRISFAFINTSWEEYIQALAPFVSQWQHLDLVSNMPESNMEVWDILSRNGAPLLEYLRLDPQYAIHPNCHPPTATSNYLALKTLSIHVTPYDTWSTPFSAVTTLSLGHSAARTTRTHLNQMLISLPHLVNLSLIFFEITILPPWNAPIVEPPKITHTSLRWLRLGDFPSLGWLTSSLILPNLHTVELCDLTMFRWYPRITPFPSVRSLIIRKHQKPVEEDDDERYFYDKILISIFPNITTLTLDVLPRFPYVAPVADEEFRYCTECETHDEDDGSYECSACAEDLAEWRVREEQREEAQRWAETELPVLNFSLAVPYDGNHIPWPDLHTLAIGNMECFHHDEPESDNLIGDLKRREALGQPIQKVVVPLGTKIIYHDHWRVLSEVAEVEESYVGTEDMWTAV